MKLNIEKPQKKSYWKPVLGVLVIAGVLLLWPHFAPRPSSPLAFEIVGFEGDAQILDLKTHAWRAPKRGEEFTASQKLKTGADGMINFQVENEIHMRLKEGSELQNEESRIIAKREVYKLRLAKGVLLGATTRQFERKEKSKQAVLQILTRDYVADIHGAIFRVQAGAQRGEASRLGVLRGLVEVAKPSPFFRPAGISVRGLEETTVVGGVLQPAVKVDAKEWALMRESYELLAKSAAMEAEQIDLSKQAGNFFNVVFDHGTFYTPKSGYAGREFFKDSDSGKVLLETEYDVFPAGSFCGVYIKTRDFDLSKYKGFSFEVRRKGEEGSPDSFFIELKSRGNVIRRFAPKTFEKNWKLWEFDFHAQKPLPVNEMVFVFTNARVGEAKKGVLEFRQFSLLPLPPASPVALKNDVKAALPSVQPAAAKPSVVASTAAPSSATATDAKQVVPKEIPLQ